MNKNWAGAIICLVFVSICLGQIKMEIGSPFIRNYSPEEYQGFQQNWAIVQDHRGVIYIGNADGILEFDGKNWGTIIQAPNKSRIRSLAIDKQGIIYAGAVGDFGYLAIDTQGKRCFVSLAEKLPDKDRDFLDVWSVISTSRGVYFGTVKHFFYWDYRKISIIPDALSFFGFLLYDQVFVRKGNSEIYMLDGIQPVLLPHTEKVAEKVDVMEDSFSILPYGDQEILIYSTKKGFFIYDFKQIFRNGAFLNNISAERIPSDIIRPFPSEIKEYLEENRLYHAIKLGHDRYAFATFKGGIVIMNTQGKLEQIINTNHGLQDNTVWNLYADHSLNLWAALNYGVSFIETGSPITKFDRFNHRKDAVLVSTRHQGRLYAGIFSGIFYLPNYQLTTLDNTHDFLPVKNSDTICFEFFSFKEYLLAIGQKGIYQIRDNEAFLLKNVSTPYCFGQSPKFPNCIFIGLQDGFAALKLNILKEKDISPGNQGILDADLINQGSFKNIKDTIIKIISDTQGNLWITSEYNGIFFVKFNGHDISDFSVYNYNTNHGLPGLYHDLVHIINNRLIVGTRMGIYEAVLPNDFPEKKERVRFIPEPTFGKIFTENLIPVREIYPDKTGRFWINSTSHGFGALTAEPGERFKWDLLPFKKINGLIVQFSVEDDGIIWLSSGTNRMLCRFDSKIKKNYAMNYSALIHQVLAGRENKVVFQGNYYDSSSKKGDYFTKSSRIQPQELMVALPFRDNSLSFTYSAAFYEHTERTRFQYQLKGFDKKWSDWTAETKKEYSNLKEGDYCFVIKALNVFEHESAPAAFRFSIIVPWQRSIWAYIGYASLLVILFYGGIRLNSRRLLAAKERLEKIVSDRTRELVVKNKEISIQKDEISKQKTEVETYANDLALTNQQLNETKDALWGEMELAKKIQTVLLPKNPKIPGYEIAAYMKPADEVGGDYYDVICIDNNDCRGGSCARPQDFGQPPGFASTGSPNNDLQSRIPGNHKGLPLQTLHRTPAPSYWLSIGDVSGHGVPAGLIMMMVQTAIHQALNSGFYHSPEKVLASVNQIIHQNIQKLGEDKYMTITLLQVITDGSIYFSGLHQDIMIYRMDRDQVELTGTRGMWLGVMSEIKDSLYVDQLILNPGDTMLLYTDGITEATNQKNEMYSEERLANLLKEHGQQSVEVIKNFILNSLNAYSCNDDVTFMIIQKK
jgi:serine phosphatase RsbU (regulator of sigma subunit)